MAAELAGGGTAIVYAAIDTALGRQVALKVMQPHGKASVSIRAVKREIQYASKAQHPNIVALLDVFVELERLVIVWELVPGSDLLDFLNEHSGRLPEPLAAHIFQQLVTAVSYMHENGYCHRDLKPENCMIERGSNLLKVIDFGLSKHLESAVTLGIGTPDYMAPELLNGSLLGGAQEVPMQVGTFSAAAADVWALGIILYLLVSGIYPFEDPEHAGDLLHTLRNVAQGRMQPLPRHVSLGCTSLVARALVRDPERRITLQEAAADPWLLELGSKGRTLPPVALATQPAPRWRAPSLQLCTRVHPASASSSGAREAMQGVQTMQGIQTTQGIQTMQGIQTVQGIQTQPRPAAVAAPAGASGTAASPDGSRGQSKGHSMRRFAGFKRLLGFSRHECRETDMEEDMALGYGGV